MERPKVFELIDGEREYQDTDPHDAGHDDASRSIADWLIFAEVHLRAAKDKVYCLNPSAALAEVRKFTALGVACMEHNETPPR